jgi:hypothetical protein
MNQLNKKPVKATSHEGQILYLDRWVDKNMFRTFVYDQKGNQKLANSYEEFEALTHSGVWFATKQEKAQVVESQNVRDIKGKSNASLSNVK